MKAEELSAKHLRIGNLVSLSGSLILTVYEIHEDCFYARDAKGGSFKNTWADLQPIPLSEEALLKCGATVDGIEYIIKASALPIKIRFHSGIAYCEFGDVYLGDRVKYLHELQNLVFALCGREMEVSL